MKMDPPDPIYHLMPQDQCERVFTQDICDIDATFLGFTSIYQSLASIIPKHWVVVDLGCAYAPQAILFAEHAAYHGVDLIAEERFSAPNTQHHASSIEDFIKTEMGRFDLAQTFAICSYVPNWGAQNIELTRMAFKNVFTFYPAGGFKPVVRRVPWGAALEKDTR